MPKTNKSRNRRRHATKGDGRGDAEDDDHENNPAPSMATAELDRDSEKDGRSGPVDGSAKQSSEDPNRKRKRLKKKKKKQKKNSSTDFTHCTTDPVLNEAATEVSAPMEQKSECKEMANDPDTSIMINTKKEKSRKICFFACIEADQTAFWSQFVLVKLRARVTIMGGIIFGKMSRVVSFLLIVDWRVWHLY